MSRFTSSRASRSLGLIALALAAGCGFTVTEERPTYAQLGPEEKGAVDVVLDELRGFNQQVESRTEYSIDSILDRERIHVSFQGLILAANLGDGLVHVSTWENLDDGQRERVREWFGQPSQEATAEVYKRFFYRFLAISQGVKQYMYESLTAGWVYGHRSLFNVERDSIRAALAHFRAIGRSDMWSFVDSACKPMLAQYNDRWGDHFDKYYLLDNFQSLANPYDPTGYVYFICRWFQLGRETVGDLSNELDWIADLPAIQARQNAGK